MKTRIMRTLDFRQTMLYGHGIREACTSTDKIPVLVQFSIDAMESEVTAGIYRNFIQILELAIESVSRQDFV